MTDATPALTPDAPDMPVKPASFAARTKKAWTAGIAGAATAIGAVSLSGLFNAHGLDAKADAVAGASIVGGFLLGFIGAYFPTNQA